MQINYFIPGDISKQQAPLTRYLPLHPVGVAATWLKVHISPGAWVLDPFGASPALVAEIARCGYRVLVAANNPIARFLIELYLRPPGEDDYRSALAELAAMTKAVSLTTSDERLEPHIRSLYQTQCEQCKRHIEAQAFIWERGTPAPLTKIYQCPSCGDNGERPVNPADVEAAMHFSSRGLHQARALERVASLDDPDRIFVQEALEIYPPRALYVLLTLINKLDSVSVNHQRPLSALLLAAFDQANTLWPYPTQRSRPRQLTIPGRYRENNIWLALEEAIGSWLQATHADAAFPDLSVETWPSLPSGSGGVSIFMGRLRDLAAQAVKPAHSPLETPLQPLPVRAALGIDLKAAVASLPRPNQAFWTLSALWTGWLWGREAAAPFKNVLHRRRYDWGWHSNALHATMSNLAALLEAQTPFFAIMSETEPGFLSSAILAAALARFDLQNLAIRNGAAQAQITWQPSATQSTSGSLEDTKTLLAPMKLRQQAQKTIRNHLLERGEPANYSTLHAAVLNSLVKESNLSQIHQSPPAEILSLVQNAIQPVFSSQGGLFRYGASEHSLEIGQWWIIEDQKLVSSSGNSGPGVQMSLSDRVEIAVVQYLINHPVSTFEKLDRMVCEEFSGLLTPEQELVQNCLESYAVFFKAGEQPSIESDQWRLRNSDQPRPRWFDLTTMQNLLEELGKRLGYTISGPILAGRPVRFPLLWQEANGEVQAAFYLIASAMMNEIIFSSRYPPERCLVVYPGGRAGLVLYKIHTNPRLKQEIDRGWRFIKFRHLHRLVEANRLTRGNLDELFGLDPMTQTDSQMTLL